MSLCTHPNELSNHSPHHTPHHYPHHHTPIQSMNPPTTHPMNPPTTHPIHPMNPIYVMHREMWHVTGVTHGDSWLSNLDSAHGHQLKGAAILQRQHLEEDEQHSWASLRWFMHIPAGVRRVITETNVLNTVEGSRLPQQGCTRCINTSVATTSDHLKVLGDRTLLPYDTLHLYKMVT